MGGAEEKDTTAATTVAAPANNPATPAASSAAREQPALPQRGRDPKLSRATAGANGGGELTTPEGSAPTNDAGNLTAPAFDPDGSYLPYKLGNRQNFQILRC